MNTQPTEAGKSILDACCGSRMFWFDRNNPDVLFADIRDEEHILCDGRELKIKPDVVMDFRDMPFQDNSFKMVVFDPPHLNRLGKLSGIHSEKAMIDCETVERFGLYLTGIEKLATPIPAKGEMGIWYYDIEQKQKAKKLSVKTSPLFNPTTP